MPPHVQQMQQRQVPEPPADAGTGPRQLVRVESDDSVPGILGRRPSSVGSDASLAGVAVEQSLSFLPNDLQVAQDQDGTQNQNGTGEESFTGELLFSEDSQNQDSTGGFTERRNLSPTLSQIEQFTDSQR